MSARVVLFSVEASPDHVPADGMPDMARSWARHAFDAQGRLSMQFIMRATRPAPCLLYILPNETPYDPAVRDAIAAGVRDLAAKHLATAVYMISEAWASVGTRATHVEPRHDPARKESLIVIAEDSALSPIAQSWFASIERGGRTIVGPWIRVDDSSGRFSKFLPIGMTGKLGNA